VCHSIEAFGAFAKLRPRFSRLADHLTQGAENNIQQSRFSCPVQIIKLLEDVSQLTSPGTIPSHGTHLIAQLIHISLPSPGAWLVPAVTVI
jgi:hypothetical protein